MRWRVFRCFPRRIFQSRTVEKSVRRVVPRSLLRRSLLIVFIPLLITQAISLELFYGNFLKVVSRRLSGAVASEIVLSLNALERLHSQSDKEWFVQQARDHLQLVETWKPNAKLTRTGFNHVLGPMDEDLARGLETAIDYPFFVNWHNDPHIVTISIQLSDGVLEVEAPRKRLDTGQILLFVAWALGSSLLLFAIASLVMRNQVRAILRLAYAAEQFGLGRDIGPIRPEGAQEVRKAAVAFNRMQDRIYRFVYQRTGVLAGVSHDLRTPLTRLRLSLAMMPQSGTLQAETLKEDIEAMVGDVAEMEHMIDSYLSFARGEGAETPEPVELGPFLHDVVTNARRVGTQVQAISVQKGLVATMRPNAMRRAVMNLLDNARRHNAGITITARSTAEGISIWVDDNGPGISPERREAVFRAFESGRGGGTGLGLTISRDIIRAHGGEMELADAPQGGLRVRIVLPE
ncbi:ATP-binding protein [Acetobacter orientalis]|uniref:histidine kinase n=1 Tax=Acetobacter orientalis TaxID=146474 RepID=A0A0D6NGG6_9PROT|nr:ATP-binding protein [Acetobacter orientalis]BBC79127.1 two-component sensor histidine kinase [Acetobacter orientalis]GAN65157.1 two component sensor histidine kinase EnvZ [Acetobacter orientalis]